MKAEAAPARLSAHEESEMTTPELQRVYHDAGVYGRPKDNLVDEAKNGAATWVDVAQEPDVAAQHVEMRVADAERNFRP